MSPSSDRSRSEYAARLNRVVDHIEAHLGEELRLDELARVACFSPFHFHRVFAAWTGETLHQHILRLRLERAASQLVHEPRKSVTAIALDCGFGGSAAFARAFRAAYGVSATAWRAGERKNCKPIRKDRKAAPAPGSYGGCEPSADGLRCAVRPQEPTPMTTQTVRPLSVRVEDLPATPLAYVRHIGPYAGDAALFGRLFGQVTRWAGARGLLGPEARLVAIYHDSPEITAPEHLRTSVGVTVPAGTRPEGEVGVMELPGGRCAVFAFELSVEEYGGAWQHVYGEWLPESGYAPDDRPCYERYAVVAPGEADPQRMSVEIVAPVRPL